MANALLKWGWLERRMERLGLSYWSLRTKHHFAKDTLKGWDKGTEAQPHSLHKLATVLEVSVVELVQNLGVKPMRIERRKAIGRRLTKARKAARS